MITAHVTWSQAILEAYFGENPEDAEEETEEEEDDGEESIEFE